MQAVLTRTIPLIRQLGRYLTEDWPKSPEPRDAVTRRNGKQTRDRRLARLVGWLVGADSDSGQGTAISIIEIPFQQRSQNSFWNAVRVSACCLAPWSQGEEFELGLAPWGGHAIFSFTVCMGCTG